jgi:hypothetical protein
MDLVKSQLKLFLDKKEPWQIAAVSSMSTLLLVWMYQFMTKDESMFLIDIEVA